MPLKVRWVVPYTLPGVLVLLGWWWYTSRKKERPGGPRTSLADGSNGLLENPAGPPPHGADVPTAAVRSQAREPEPPRCRTGPEEDPPSPEAPGPRRTPDLRDRRDQGPEEPLLPVQVSGAAHLTDAERPEPEGEVAKHQGAPGGDRPPEPVQRPRQQAPDPVQRVSPPPSDAEQTTGVPDRAPGGLPAGGASPETPPPVHHLPQQDLEILAAGLITEVISAATQEVMAASEGRGRGPLLEEAGQHRLRTGPLLGGAERPDTSPKEAADAPNGCSSAGSREGDPWTTPPPRGAAAQAEDSACSTCHSEDGVSSEDLQGGASDPRLDIQVTHLSSAPPPGNGIGVRNGAPGTCEVDTDQSGGSDVNSMDSVDSGCTMGAVDHQGPGAASSGLVIWEIEVPKHLVGRLIGKQGRYVSFLKQSSGAKIYISTLPYTQEFQICHLEGEQQQVDKALALIGKKFKDLDLANLYAPPPPPLTLPSLPMTSWLLLPSGVTVEVMVVSVVSAGHVFVQQHTHPTYHALRGLDQQMFLCYSQPGTPALPSPAEVGVICAAPAVDGAWWRAQVISFYKDSSEVEIRYVDYGGYDRVAIDALRQIRSDFVTLPFQGAEVLLDNIAPLPGEDRFSADATAAFEGMTRGVALLAQVSNYDNNTGLPLVHLWNMVGDEVISVNRSLVERGVAAWVDSF